MGGNPNADGWVNPRLPLTASSPTGPTPILIDSNPNSEGWVNPRCPLTAMKSLSGGVVGDGGRSYITALIAARRQTHLGRPPVATCTGDLGAAELIFVAPPSPPVADLSSDDDGLAGRSEEESSPLTWLSLPDHMKAANPEMWAEAVAEAEAFVKDMEKNGFF